MFAASILMLALAPAVLAEDPPAPQADARTLSETLIYSVNRVPERTFETR
jgi:hypothetical protein